ncbi:hypothetical protein HYH03_010709 [Edaphochlamys debaryana]|uniref:Uncharacterized protein n=1 Tax=Edaphochlamys debaryana TaxID=47281 RepID=A0A835XT90_9CHLO|nr:hypothetical protein HYH03_010709 [Edaphochlamys debaryana]|eukprot:KAG2490787.1 hypothetical protein HYH03_010709 [Edaphochlamys debaryana]
MATTQLTNGLCVAHVCGHTCAVVHEFGNMYRCQSSGLVHICDSTCNQRLYHDKYHTICRISRKLHPPFESDAMEAEAPRKRGGDEELQETDSWKRRSNPPVTC